MEVYTRLITFISTVYPSIQPQLETLLGLYQEYTGFRRADEEKHLSMLLSNVPAGNVEVLIDLTDGSDVPPALYNACSISDGGESSSSKSG